MRARDTVDHDGQGATLGAAALILIDRLGPNPQHDAQPDRSDEMLHVPGPQAR
jgi:hypothetical protein